MKLSKQLAELSVHAKHAEDAVAAAQKEAHDKVMARREKARAAATAAAQKVDRDIKSAAGSVKSAGDTAEKKWTALRAKIDNDLQVMKEGIVRKKHEHDVGHAEKHAEWLEWEAEVAVEYAIAAIDQAELAVLDAVASRVEAEQAKRA